MLNWFIFIQGAVLREKVLTEKKVVNGENSYPLTPYIKYLLPGAMARLCFLALFVIGTFSSNSSANTLRVERDACEQKEEEANECRKK